VPRRQGNRGSHPFVVLSFPPQGYDKAIDIWGVGLLTFIMLFGANPFAKSSQFATHDAIAECDWQFPEGNNASNEAKEFVRTLLKVSFEPGPLALA